MTTFKDLSVGEDFIIVPLKTRYTQQSDLYRNPHMRKISASGYMCLQSLVYYCIDTPCMEVVRLKDVSIPVYTEECYDDDMYFTNPFLDSEY